MRAVVLSKHFSWLFERNKKRNINAYANTFWFKICGLMLVTVVWSKMFGKASIYCKWYAYVMPPRGWVTGHDESCFAMFFHLVPSPSHGHDIIFGFSGWYSVSTFSLNLGACFSRCVGTFTLKWKVWNVYWQYANCNWASVLMLSFRALWKYEN